LSPLSIRMGLSPSGSQQLVGTVPTVLAGDSGL
jgi:hypothetical protein